MMMSEICNYVVITLGLCWVMIFRKLSFNSHRLWAIVTIFLFKCGVIFGSRVYKGFQRKKTSDIEGGNMGGKRKRVELESCMEWMKKTEVWDILRCGNFIGYMERLKGNNLAITHQFIKSWKDGSVMVGN